MFIVFLAPKRDDHLIMLSPKAALSRLFLENAIQQTWFSTQFVTEISIKQVEEIVLSLTADLGEFQDIHANNENDFIVSFQDGLVDTLIILNDEQQITSLLFHPPRPKQVDILEAVEQLKQFPGHLSLLIMEDDKKLVSLNENVPFAVGSAFKLAVLSALKSQVQSFKYRWNDVVQLQDQYKSLPSGILQNWPSGSFLTIETLATLMISESDNTATDHLMRLLGLTHMLEEHIAPRNRPFLTTRQAFLLKSTEHTALLDRYRHADENTRRQLLTEEIDTLPFLPSPHTLGTATVDIEWYFTAFELYSLMKEVVDLPMMSINTGLIKPDDVWTRIAYKGGSEVGVLNMTTWLTAKSGTSYCVVGTWNDTTSSLEEKRFEKVYAQILEELRAMVLEKENKD